MLAIDILQLQAFVRYIDDKDFQEKQTLLSLKGKITEKLENFFFKTMDWPCIKATW